MENSEKKGLNISARCFITAIAVIFALMIITYVLTFVVPGGEYARITDADGSTIIDTEGGFKYIDGGISFVKWIFSPLLVLTAEGNATLIAVIAFLLVIGGVFNSLEKCGLMKYMLDKISAKYGKARYKLMAVVIFFFMAMGAFIGSFEECVPLVPIVVALAISLGWDALTGVGMSLLAVGCGFASGICNPFTVGVAQGLAGLPMFSGMWLRAVSFVFIYALLLWFVRRHAKKIEKPVSGCTGSEFEIDAKKEKGLKRFVAIVGLGLAIVVSSSFISALQDYTMIIVALMFLVAGIVSPLTSGMSVKSMLETFFNGLVSILPAVVMILMAASIKYTLDEARILDTMLYYAVGAASTMPKWVVVLFIYAIVLIMNFFIGSGSAKAFMLIPLIVPLAQVFGVSPQLCIMAFAFGDGFSNVFYPTNAALLISLGLANVSYGDWVKWSWKFQGINLLLTSALLLFGFAIGYC
ncbi:MAG: AbgT family transporter [Bacillota bacterium]|nr:AbgT family transporter [Bacillota bacterium]